MIKKFYKINKKKYKNEDKLTAKVLSSLSTNKYYNQALDAGLNVLIVENNNIVQVDKTRNKKIISKLEHPNYKLYELKNILKNKKINIILK